MGISPIQLREIIPQRAARPQTRYAEALPAQKRMSLRRFPSPARFPAPPVSDFRFFSRRFSAAAAKRKGAGKRKRLSRRRSGIHLRRLLHQVERAQDSRFSFRPFRSGPTCFAAAGAIFRLSAGKPRHSAFLACDTMVTSFLFRGGPEKKRSKEKGPPARRKIPVARTPFRSACNSLSAHFRLERRCRIPPQQYRLRDAARRSFSCRRFLRRHRDFSNGRCHPAAHLRSGQYGAPPKIKKTAHTVRPAPTPGPLTLTLSVPIHFDSRIKIISRLRTSLIHSSDSSPSGKRQVSSGDGPKGADTIFLKCEWPNLSRPASPCVREA